MCRRSNDIGLQELRKERSVRGAGQEGTDTWQRDGNRGCGLASGRWWPSTVYFFHAASFCLRDGSSLHPPDPGIYQTKRQHIPDDGIHRRCCKDAWACSTGIELKFQNLHT